MNFETILITGANRGIGLELARQYLKSGSRVVATCRKPEKASELATLALQQHNLQINPLEVTAAASVQRLALSLANQCIDVLINNAGILGGEDQSIDSMDYDAWTETLAVNTIAPFRVSLALLANLRLSRRPRILALSSQMGSMQRASSGYYAYRSSKAALNKVMQGLAVDLRSDGIIVCPVHPGWVRTDMGGPQADITVEESAAGLIELINGLTIADSGHFFKWNNTEHPW
jgi:NAD(P)-dependent dehydrogenase (short-subunit alcohol dehydrogenase family)